MQGGAIRACLVIGLHVLAGLDYPRRQSLKVGHEGGVEAGELDFASDLSSFREVLRAVAATVLGHGRCKLLAARRRPQVDENTQDAAEQLLWVKVVLQNLFFQCEKCL